MLVGSERLKQVPLGFGCVGCRGTSVNRFNVRLKEGIQDLVDLWLVTLIALRIDQVTLLKQVNYLLDKVLLVFLIILILFIVLLGLRFQL